MHQYGGPPSRGTGRILCAAPSSTIACLRNPADPSAYLQLAHGSQIVFACMHPSGNLALTLGSTYARVWRTGRNPLNYIELPTDPAHGPHTAAISPDEEWIAIAGSANRPIIYLWDLRKEPQCTQLQLAEDLPRTILCFSPNGSWLAAWSVCCRSPGWVVSDLRAPEKPLSPCRPTVGREHAFLAFLEAGGPGCSSSTTHTTKTTHAQNGRGRSSCSILVHRPRRSGCLSALSAMSAMSTCRPSERWQMARNPFTGWHVVVVGSYGR